MTSLNLSRSQGVCRNIPQQGILGYLKAKLKIPLLGQQINERCIVYLVCLSCNKIGSLWELCDWARGLGQPIRGWSRDRSQTNHRAPYSDRIFSAFVALGICSSVLFYATWLVLSWWENIFESIHIIIVQGRHRGCCWSWTVAVSLILLPRTYLFIKFCCREFPRRQINLLPRKF